MLTIICIENCCIIAFKIHYSHFQNFYCYICFIVMYVILLLSNLSQHPPYQSSETKALIKGRCQYLWKQYLFNLKMYKKMYTNIKDRGSTPITVWFFLFWHAFYSIPIKLRNAYCTPNWIKKNMTISCCCPFCGILYFLSYGKS